MQNKMKLVNIEQLSMLQVNAYPSGALTTLAGNGGACFRILFLMYMSLQTSEIREVKDLGQKPLIPAVARMNQMDLTVASAKVGAAPVSRSHDKY